MRNPFVTVMAAHAAATKANAHAHHAQGAANNAAPSDELFAALLAKAGNADETDDKAGKDAKADVEKTIDPHGGKLKKSKDATDEAAADLLDMGAMPAHLAVLNAKFASANGQTPPTQQGKKADSTDPVDAADAAKNAAHDTAPILNRILDAKASDKAAHAKDPGKKNPAEDVGAATVKTDAAAMTANAVPAAQVNPSPKAADAAPAKGAATSTLTPAEIAAVTSAAQAGDATKADAGKLDAASDQKKTDKGDDAKSNATKDAQTSLPDKATALAAAVDKNTRQIADAQVTQARALPVQLQAQVSAGKDSGNSQTGGDTKHPAQTQHAKSDSAAQPNADAVQPATQAPLNTAGATQTVAHTENQTANVQPVTAQNQTQASPTVTASLQVAPQMAAQAQVPPDVAALAIQIASKSQEGSKQFDIRLDPPELGRVDVKLSIDDTGRAQAHLSVEKPQTLDLLQHDRSSLERALKDSGVDLSQNGLNFSLKGQDRQSDNSAPFRGRSRNLAVTAAIETTSAAVAASTHSFAAGNTRLDIRV